MKAELRDKSLVAPLSSKRAETLIALPPLASLRAEGGNRTLFSRNSRACSELIGYLQSQTSLTTTERTAIILQPPYTFNLIEQELKRFPLGISLLMMPTTPSVCHASMNKKAFLNLTGLFKIWFYFSGSIKGCLL